MKKSEQSKNKMLKRVPALRFPEFLEGKEWQEKQLYSVCQMKAGKFISASKINTQYIEGLYPCYGGNGLRGFTSEYSHSGEYSLIGRQGALCGNVNFVTGRFYATEHAIVISPNKKINNNWLFYCLNKLNLNQYAIGQAQPGLSVNFLEKITIQIPEQEKEQQKIADCLSSLDNVISLQTQKIEALQQYKKGVMQKLFPAERETVPELRFGGFQNEDAWHSLDLGSCLLKRPEYGVNAPAVPFSKELPTYLRITDIAENGSFIHKQKTSVAKNVTDSNYLKKGDIVLARTGASVGKSYLYNEKDGALVFAGFLIRVRPNQKKLNSGFLFQYLKTEQYWKWVSLNSARSGQPGINGSEYSALPIVLPSMQEQQKIADCLSSLDELIDTETQKLDVLRIHKTGLMQQLFPAMDEVNA
ncbi:restriction endonuclease subunit S [Klebsiella variicola]|nr:restriction endonuclease subunit S [Klebsiella variicola subsp. variicola]